MRIGLFLWSTNQTIHATPYQTNQALSTDTMLLWLLWTRWSKNKEIHSTFSRLAGVESQKTIRSVVRESEKQPHDSPTKKNKQTVHFQYRNFIKIESFGDQHFEFYGNRQQSDIISFMSSAVCRLEIHWWTWESNSWPINSFVKMSSYMRRWLSQPRYQECFGFLPSMFKETKTHTV